MQSEDLRMHDLRIRSEELKVSPAKERDHPTTPNFECLNELPRCYGEDEALIQKIMALGFTRNQATSQIRRTVDRILEKDAEVTPASYVLKSNGSRKDAVAGDDDAECSACAARPEERERPYEEAVGLQEDADVAALRSTSSQVLQQADACSEKAIVQDATQPSAVDVPLSLPSGAVHDRDNPADIHNRNNSADGHSTFAASDARHADQYLLPITPVSEVQGSVAADLSDLRLQEHPGDFSKGDIREALRLSEMDAPPPTRQIDDSRMEALIAQVLDLGFTRSQAVEAFKRCSTADAAVEWIITRS